MRYVEVEVRRDEVLGEYEGLVGERIGMDDEMNGMMRGIGLGKEKRGKIAEQ